jgi:hypothetical protein
VSVCGDTGLVGIRLARVAEPSVVQEIDRASARMFNDVGMPEISQLLWPLEALAACRAAGRLWVITGCDDRPAGFLVTDVVDGCSHVEQVSVMAGPRGFVGRASVFRDVLQCLQDAEVNSGLGVARVASDAGRLDQDRD